MKAIYMSRSGPGYKGAAGEARAPRRPRDDQSRLYIATTHAPPRPRLCCNATFAPST
jgi:hypothetical protein